MKAGQFHFRRQTLAGHSFVDSKKIDYATRFGTNSLNWRAKSWVWGRPQRPPRPRRRAFVYLRNEALGSQASGGAQADDGQERRAEDQAEQD
jgi:hypothetical protein